MKTNDGNEETRKEKITSYDFCGLSTHSLFASHSSLSLSPLSLSLCLLSVSFHDTAFFATYVRTFFATFDRTFESFAVMRNRTGKVYTNKNGSCADLFVSFFLISFPQLLTSNSSRIDE